MEKVATHGDFSISGLTRDLGYSPLRDDYCSEYRRHTEQTWVGGGSDWGVV